MFIRVQVNDVSNKCIVNNLSASDCLKQSKLVLGPTIINGSINDSLTDILEKLSDEEMEIETVILFNKLSNEAVSCNVWDLPWNQIVALVGGTPEVIFIKRRANRTINTTPRNAFDVLMEAAKGKSISENALKYPSVACIKGTHYKRLAGKLIGYMRSECIGSATSSIVIDVLNPWLNGLTSMLFMLDGHASKLMKSTKGVNLGFWVNNSFIGESTDSCLFNNWKATKAIKPALSKERLENAVERVEGSMIHPFFSTRGNLAFLKRLAELLQMMNDHVAGMEKRAIQQDARNQSLILPNSSGELNKISITEERTGHAVSSVLATLVQYMKEVDFYNPVCTKPFEDEYVEDTRSSMGRSEEKVIRQRYKKALYTNNVLNMKTFCWQYSSANNLGTIQYIVKVPLVSSVDSHEENKNEVLTQLKESIPIYVRRALRYELKRVVQSMDLSKGNAKSSLSNRINLLLRKCVGNSCSIVDFADENNLKKIHELERAVDDLIILGDDEIVVEELTDRKGPGKTRFSIFWKAVEQVLEEIDTAADERRHDTTQHLSSFISIRDFRAQVAERCPEGTPVPSLEYVRLQFMPRNFHHKTSLQFSCQFNLKFAIQRRQLRKSNVDSHYALALFKYMREFVTLIYKMDSRSVAQVFADDKAKINVGQPGQPVSTGVRGRRQLVYNDRTIAALDHDMSSLSLTPSAVFIPDLDQDKEITSAISKWYCGQVFISIKDTATEPSNCVRHSLELETIIRSTYDLDYIPSILSLYTDGGGDHNPSFVRVQLTLVALCISLDLDFLIAGRTAGGQSYVNPCERTMSTTNFALQNVALERTAMDAEFEREMSSANTNKAISAVCAKPGNREKYDESMKSVKTLLEERIQRLVYTEVPYKIYKPCDSDAIANFSQTLFQVEELKGVSTDFVKCPSQSLCDKNASEWMNKHCRIGHYMFQVKKIMGCECSYCTRPIRTRADVWEKVHWVPYPEILEGCEHYKSFEEVYDSNSPTKERFVPSLQPGYKQKGSFINTVKATKQSIRGIIECTECHKPRGYFSKTKLSKTDAIKVLDYVDNYNGYVCGDPFILCRDENENNVEEMEEDGESDTSSKMILNQPVETKSNLTCRSAISAPVYKLQPMTCFKCGYLDDSNLSKESFYPMCHGCNSIPGISWVKRGTMSRKRPRA